MSRDRPIPTRVSRERRNERQNVIYQIIIIYVKVNFVTRKVYFEIEWVFQ